jgi:hypothetical protein
MSPNPLPCLVFNTNHLIHAISEISILLIDSWFRRCKKTLLSSHQYCL